ncbi:dicarboxylate transporter/tellurite-resistance protein TehA [Bosea caraganae]|uniref:Dicarboxylate transporter/tellurite-resistance protein TehA n=1 Tax=Bosea caraganae TaxID=2763117 RepID=A0A370L2C1_9HYPH|nr:dicarboxylate transporter/tellurite-resistance protein TehA [Bosea caraganae]RDJ22219.1 dicarboxylate transporter/tellurite-resistance protein TehA [Bosea caraganae]RDJ22694.1 dicarboxylate transporter/tellurite-resistance protein TehA [Bosea caraganae]
MLTLKPVMFGAVLGIGGLANGWRVASRLWGVPAQIGETLAYLAFAVWAMLTALYALKWLRHTAVAREELRHPVQAPVAALIPVTTMIASLAIAPHAPVLGWWIYLTGALGMLGFAVWSIGGLWQGGREHAATTPILYLPIVGGGFVAAFASAYFGQGDAGWMFFGMGLLSWLGLESVVLARLFTLKLPVELRATLGIHLAPAAVGSVAYSAISPVTGATNHVALLLLGYGLFLALVVLRLLPWLREQSFGPGAWSYTFGVSALPLAALRLVEQGAGAPVVQLALALFIAANLIIGRIALRSLVLVGQFAFARPQTTT